MEIADNGCCCFRVAVSCGGCGGIGILLLLVFVDARVSPLVDDVGADAMNVMGAMGGGGGGGRGGSVPTVCGITTGICM